MTRLASILAALTVLLPYSLVAPFATTPPELMTVSGTIELTATATSTNGHIVQLVLFINGTPVATNQPPAPGNLQVQ